MARSAAPTGFSVLKVIKPDTRICVLFGPDEFVKHKGLETLRGVITEKHGAAESTSFDGKTAQLSDVFDELRGYSLMQEYKIVVVENADEFTTRHRDALQRYAEQPVDHATLVLRAGKWNKGNLDKAIEKCGCIVRCDPPDFAESETWLIEIAAPEAGCRIDKQAARQLVSRMGGDLGLIVSEIAKMASSLPPGGTIDSKLVSDMTGRSSDEDAYAIQRTLLDAIASGGSPESVRELIHQVHELIDLAGHPKEVVTYFLADQIRKLRHGVMQAKQGVSINTIAGQQRVWGDRIRPFEQAIRRLTPQSSAQLLDRIIELDRRAKSGRGEGVRNLECFCAALGDLAR